MVLLQLSMLLLTQSLHVAHAASIRGSSSIVDDGLAAAALAGETSETVAVRFLQSDPCNGTKSKHCNAPTCTWRKGNCIPAPMPNPTSSPVTPIPTDAPTKVSTRGLSEKYFHLFNEEELEVIKKHKRMVFTCT